MRQTNQVRVGTIAKADAAKGCQIEFAQEDGKPIPSAWFPHPEQGGTLKTWSPMPVGQIVFAICPDGDQRQGFIIPKGGFSDQNPAPSDKLEEHVETLGTYKRTLTKDGLTIAFGDKASISLTAKVITLKIGDVYHTVNADGSAFMGGKVTHESRNIGKDHKHGQVKSGGEPTGDPEA